MFMSQYIYLNFVASIFLYVNGDTILNEKKNGECILPNHPANGKWIIIGGSDAQPGSSVSSLTAITYFCEEPYKLSSDYSLITCLGNHWNLLQPECLSDEEKTNEVKRTAYGEVVATGDIVNQRGKRYATPQGGRGGDGIVIKSGRGKTVIGPGEEGSSYYDERGIARGGQGGTGVIRGGWNGNERQTRGQTYNGDGRGGYDEYYDELPEQTEDRISGRGGDGVVIRNGRIRGNIVGIGGQGRSRGYYRRKRETLNQPSLDDEGEKTNKVKRAVILSRNAYGEVVAMEDTDDQSYNRYATQGGRGGDGIVIQSGRGKTVIGPGEEGYYDERGQARGGQGGTGVIRGGQGSIGWNKNTGQRGGGGQNYYGDKRKGQDGLVIGPGETVNGYGIGIGQPGANGQRTGGRGGNGVVVDRGSVNGGLIGQGGYGGYGRYPNSNNNRKQGGGGYGQGTGYYVGSLEENADWIGGRGGDGIVIRGGRVRGNIVGIGGRGGSGGYYRRKRATQNPPIVENCGEKRTRQFFVDGKNVKKTIYPWATAVYKKVLGEFQYFCGATMLTQRIIVTVAHCVTNYPDNDVIPAEKLKIAVGKYYQDYNNSKDTQAQFSDVMKVLVNPKYRGINLRYAADIAFLITKDQLTLSNVVQPVCYQNIRNIDLNDELEGVLTGWGFPDSTSVSPSNELQGIALPFQNEAICLKEIPEDFGHDYLTYDKMCIGYYNKSMKFCGGISGNSLTFPYNGKYYIHGIISIGKKDSTQGLCNILAKSTLYTKVSAHYDWLERVISQYQ